MERTAVKSSNIRSVGYDSDQQLLEVEFGTGGVYRFENVPAEVHTQLMAAESVGSHFARRIRGKYTTKKVDPQRQHVGGQA